MKLRVPHTFVLLFALIALAAIATHFLAAGEYDRVVGANGRQLVDPRTYHAVEAHPASLGDVALAYPRGLLAVALIVFYIFLIGGTFGVLNATGAIEGAIGRMVGLCRGRGEIVLPVLMVLFSIGGGTIGMAEETLPFLPALVLLAKRLGYDEVTGGAIALVGAGAGFSGAFLNPFTVGVGQQIAGLPPLSGMGFRLIVWAVVTLIAVVYVARYARRIRRAPETSPGEEESTWQPLTARQIGVLALLVLGLGAIVLGALRWQWGLLELAGLFVAIGVLAGIVGGLGADRTAEKFLEGAAGIAAGALVVGLARGVLVIFDGARVTDTILHGMAGAVQGLPAEVTVVGIYGVQVALSYLVPSGSGQAALSLPILAPLADLVGVTRQTSVLAYQFGDGFSNIFTPTSGYFMAALALVKVPWTKWARFMWPLQLLWLGAGLALLLVAHAIRWGPF
ncbi:MAG: AbgT family transporter [Thermoanaerobaculia bacterium]